MSEERATYGEEQPDITDDNWKLAELERLLADKEKELQRARTAINNLLTYDTCKEHREKLGTENWVNVYKERQAFGCVYCTKEKVEEAKEKAKRLEAEMAAFRETFRINEVYAAEKANIVDEQGLKLSEQDWQIKELEEALTKLVNAYHGLYVANQVNCGRKTNDEEIENIPVIKAARKALGEKDAQDV